MTAEQVAKTENADSGRGLEGRMKVIRLGEEGSRILIADEDDLRQAGILPRTHDA